MQPILTLSGHDPEPHVTDIGGKDVCRLLVDWLASIPPGTYPAIDMLNDTCSSFPTDQLATQLEDAAWKHDPPDGETQEAIVLLLDRLGLGYPDETLELEF